MTKFYSSYRGSIVILKQLLFRRDRILGPKNLIVMWIVMLRLRKVCTNFGPSRWTGPEGNCSLGLECLLHEKYIYSADLNDHTFVLDSNKSLYASTFTIPKTHCSRVIDFVRSLPSPSCRVSSNWGRTWSRRDKSESATIPSQGGFQNCILGTSWKLTVVIIVIRDLENPLVTNVNLIRWKLKKIPKDKVITQFFGHQVYFKHLPTWYSWSATWKTPQVSNFNVFHCRTQKMEGGRWIGGLGRYHFWGSSKIDVTFGGRGDKLTGRGSS